MRDMAKGQKDMNDAAVRNATVIELQQHILTAKEAQSALLEEIRSLITQMARMETWEADKQRYTLKEIEPGQFAYALEEETAGGEPTHLLCANCYNQSQKPISHTETRMPGRHTVLFCQDCGWAQRRTPPTSS